MKSFLRKRWKLLVGIAVSIFFLWLSLRGLKLQDVWTYIRQANYGWIVPGVLVYFVAVWARTWRWHYLLRPIKAIPLPRLFPTVCIGYFGNNVYPARAGEVIRAVVLKRDEGVSVSASLATVIVERVFDGLVMLLFVFFALPFVGTEHIPPIYRTTVIIASALFFVALAAFLWMAFDPQRVLRIYNFGADRLASARVWKWLDSLVERFMPQRLLRISNFCADRLAPARVRKALDGFIVRFMDGLKSLRSGRDVLMVFCTSVVIWLLETVKYWFVAHAFRFVVSFIGLMLMNGVVNLTTTLPSAPAYIGTFEFGANVLAALRIDSELAMAYTLVLHAALWFPITALGAFYMWRKAVKWQDFDATNIKRS